MAQDGAIRTRVAAVEALGTALEELGRSAESSIADARSVSQAVRRSAETAQARRRADVAAAVRASATASQALSRANPQVRPALEAALRQAQVREAHAKSEQARVDRSVAVLMPALERLRAALNVAEQDIVGLARDGQRSALGYADDLGRYLGRNSP